MKRRRREPTKPRRAAASGCCGELAERQKRRVAEEMMKRGKNARNHLCSNCASAWRLANNPRVRESRHEAMRPTLSCYAQSSSKSHPLLICRSLFLCNGNAPALRPSVINRLLLSREMRMCWRVQKHIWPSSVRMAYHVYRRINVTLWILASNGKLTRYDRRVDVMVNMTPKYLIVNSNAWWLK